MKISIYALHLGFGGVEKYVITLANMLSIEHDVTIVSTYKIVDNPAFQLSEKVKVEYLMEDLKPNKERLQQCIKQKNILGMIKEGLYAVKVLHYKNTLNKKSVKNCTADVIISTRIFHNELISRYADPKIIKITGEHNHHNNNEKYIKDVISSCRNFDYFIPISKELCDFYKEPMKQNGVKTKYIRFCIDDNPNFKEPDFNNNNLISVARLSQEKGIYDLLDVFEEVHKETTDAVLNLVGDGPEYEKIKSVIREKGLEGSVVLHGFQNKEYIYDLLSKSSLYVMTSYTESFGIVLLEAMSCKIPCVAYSSAQGAHEIIEEGYNGFLIDNRDRTLMKETICRLLNNKDELRDLSENAFATADKFSYSNTRKNWLEFMNELNKGDR